MMQRRHVLGTGLATGLVAMLPVAAFAANRLAFDVRRNGSSIGHHHLTFDRRDSELTVAIDIELKVKLAFITLYSYSHQNRETWREGIFQSFSSHTDDNGDKFVVEARRQGDEIAVRANGERTMVPGDAMPTTYWHREFMQRERWIDTQSGRLVESSVTDVGPQALVTPIGTFDARHYRLSGDLDVELWYRQAQWVGLKFKGSDGSDITYHLVEEPVQQVSLH